MQFFSFFFLSPRNYDTHEVWGISLCGSSRVLKQKRENPAPPPSRSRSQRAPPSGGARGFRDVEATNLWGSCTYGLLIFLGIRRFWYVVLFTTSGRFFNSYVLPLRLAEWITNNYLIKMKNKWIPDFTRCGPLSTKLLKLLKSKTEAGMKRWAAGRARTLPPTPPDYHTQIDKYQAEIPLMQLNKFICCLLCTLTRSRWYVIFERKSSMQERL